VSFELVKKWQRCEIKRGRKVNDEIIESTHGVGFGLGSGVGSLVGRGLGTGVGAGVGTFVGAGVGSFVGGTVGTGVGLLVGALEAGGLQQQKL
jgi:hypothetical protein